MLAIYLPNIRPALDLWHPASNLELILCCRISDCFRFTCFPVWRHRYSTIQQHHHNSQATATTLHWLFFLWLLDFCPSSRTDCSSGHNSGSRHLGTSRLVDNDYIDIGAASWIFYKYTQHDYLHRWGLTIYFPAIIIAYFLAIFINFLLRHHDVKLQKLVGYPLVCKHASCTYKY